MKSLVSKLSVRLIFKNLKLVTVESCTGGLIGKVMTDMVGSSDWYEGGFITYSNRAKTKLVNVPEIFIDKYGAVSIEVAEAMAKGASIQFPDCVSVSVTGIAGPGGGTPEKPVGTVCIACHHCSELKTRRFIFEGSRDDVREQTVRQALEMLLSMDLKK